MSEDDVILVARLRAAVATLPEPERTVLCCLAVDGQDDAAVAARLGSDLREVERLVASALVLLARLLTADADDEGRLGNGA